MIHTIGCEADRNLVGVTLPPPPAHAASPTAPPATPMSPTGVRIWRSVGGVALGVFVLAVPFGGPTESFKPIVYLAAFIVAAAGLMWAFKLIGNLGLLNAFTVGAAVVGLVSGSGIDGTSNLGYLFAGFIGLVCVGLWIAALVRGRTHRPRHWWANPKWWIVPVVAIAALVLTPVVEDQRFEHSRADLTAFAEQQLAMPLKGDGTGRCTDFKPDLVVGTYRVRYACVSEGWGLYRLSVRIMFDDSTEYELDYGDPATGGPRVWHKYLTHS